MRSSRVLAIKLGPKLAAAVAAAASATPTQRSTTTTLPTNATMASPTTCVRLGVTLACSSSASPPSSSSFSDLAAALSKMTPNAFQRRKVAALNTNRHAENATMRNAMGRERLLRSVDAVSVRQHAQSPTAPHFPSPAANGFPFTSSAFAASHSQALSQNQSNAITNHTDLCHNSKKQTASQPLRIALRRTVKSGRIVRVAEGKLSCPKDEGMESNSSAAFKSKKLPHYHTATSTMNLITFQLKPRLQRHLNEMDKTLRFPALFAKKAKRRKSEHVRDTTLHCENSCCGSSTMPPEQSALVPPYVGLVACGVSTTPFQLTETQSDFSTSPRQRFLLMDPADSFTIGVNYAIHRLINNEGEEQRGGIPSPPPPSSYRSGGGLVISGLLKGCAEQNALGAFAAKGLAPFTAVRTVVLYGRHVETIAKTALDSPSNADVWWETIFPCRQCWSHLCAIASATAAARMSASSTPFGDAVALSADASSGSSPSQPDSSTFTVCISVANWAEVELLKKAIAEHCRRCEQRASLSASSTVTAEMSAVGFAGPSSSQPSEVSENGHHDRIECSNSALTNAATVAADVCADRIEWFLRRHEHLMSALSMEGNVSIVDACVRHRGQLRESSVPNKVRSQTPKMTIAALTLALPRIVLMVDETAECTLRR